MFYLNAVNNAALNVGQATYNLKRTLCYSLSFQVYSTAIKPPRMHNLYKSSLVFLIVLSTLAQVSLQLDYSDLEAEGVTCPDRDKCEGYQYDRSYMERNCECDSACKSYGDCCIDANTRRSSSRLVQQTNKVCMNFGAGNHTGVYAVAHCSSSWTGSQAVRDKCEGPTDFSDPMAAAPVTSIAQSVTYKNLFCAECNNAHMQSLKTFQFQLACDGLDDMSEAQIIGDLFYDEQRGKWGLNRSDVESGSVFVKCDIFFNVSASIAPYVRFCRANLISTCASNWTRNSVRNKCGQYMAVVYEVGDDDNAYMNPHCAICNHKSLTIVDCRGIKLTGKNKTPLSGGDLIYVNEDNNPSCPPGQKYDIFFKVCRRMVCAIPGYQVVNGRCAPGG